MLRSLFVLVIATLSFTGVALAQKAPPPPLPAGSCAKRKDCVRQPTCAAGQTLVALPAHRFVCRVSSTQVEAKEAPRCERGALVVAEGFDYCEWTVTDDPWCARHGGHNDWAFADGKCIRQKANKQVEQETQNIRCDDGLSYNATAKRCTGKRRQHFSFLPTAGAAYTEQACDAVLPGSTYLADFAGRGDQCVKLDESTTWFPPTWN
ncbi:MAG: hypothetical protein HS111_25370 [Kofleriaceae bacterium]|nr:hypothetical protein [Kofleriaceae bacterium]MCL4223651.1 hypothetical protein [Myxococcales bacterium]